VLESPNIDKQVGIQYYCTKFKGIGGSIKNSNENFKVSEVVDKRFLENLSSNQDGIYRFPIYTLEKNNIDSNHALIEIERKLGIRLKIMGIKDAKAHTTQYVSSEQTKKLPRVAKTQNTMITLLGFSRTPLKKSLLGGNHFVITIEKPRSSDVSSFMQEITKVANFYGLQRFGRERLVTHIVGKEIVKRNFRKAIELLLSYTTEYDSEVSKEIRKKLRDPANFPYIYKQLPKWMDIEFMMISALVKGKESISVLRSIPISIRRLFVQAYQAYLFNKCLSNAIMNGEEISVPKHGDLCFELQEDNIFGKVRKFNQSVDHTSKLVPAIRMAGYTFQPGKGRFDIITNNILKEEGIQPRDFYIREMDELSAQGGFRQASLLCRDFHYFNSLVLSFKLSAGSYATILLREIMKPIDPIDSGF
jgi:tRNA pseudouridine13 synthase